VSFGPYKIVEWEPGVAITEEAYDGYTPIGDHYEFQKPYIKKTKWLWRNEPTVAGAMIETSEADIAWDIGIDVAQSLSPEMVRSGGSTEVYAVDINTLWNPELQKVKVRQAMAHAINCQEMIDSLYAGKTVCRGNIIFPGVVGAREENTAPYTYDPEVSRQLLQEADYDPNTTFTFAGRSDRFPKQSEVRESIQAYLKDVGINVDIQTVESSRNRELRNCRAGAAVNDVLKASGRTPGQDQPTFDDFRAALAAGGASCPSVDLQENFPSNETLDFGRQATYYLNCEQIASPHCDPSPGGFQEMLPKALAATGKERQELLQAMADRVHDEVLWLAEFDTPVFYAVNPKLNWTPRFDRRVRVNTMWFSP
jgi:ABC-type transport system substrate-binding protein